MPALQRRRTAVRYLLATLLGLLLVSCVGGRPGPLPDVLFVRISDHGRANLYRQAGPDGQARQLSAQPAGNVLDFAPSPDGRQIAYSVADGANSELRRVDAGGGDDRQLLACPAAECSSPVWSPDGRRLVYERRAISGGTLGSPRLHWFDVATGETLPLIAGEETPGYGARFSPDGAWLSYVSPGDNGVVLYRFSDGSQRLISSYVGRPAAFSPDSAQVVLGDLVLEAYPGAPELPDASSPLQESASVYLYRVDLGQPLGVRERLSPPLAVDDSAPAWSPDGEWIAFGRGPADVAAGRQLWLMRSDGSDARALTNDALFTHGPPAWSPDGSTLLYQRIDLNDPAARPQVWQLRVADGRQTLIAEPGYLPAWLTSHR